MKLDNKDVFFISRIIVKLFRYSKDGLNKEEKRELANELQNIIFELLKK